MRSFQQVVVFLFALVAFAFAQDTVSYDATVYVTSTIYRVNTVTMSGYPTGSVANSTTTIHASVPTAPVYSAGNSTAPYPTGTMAPSSPAPSATEFPGAASQMSINSALVAVLAAGIGYLAL
ncbi:hypothetical protein BU26DRAFT_299302 [Trematosphaeria pertusa]|uniref:Uncharacterized protein n=1 Tax=Trematosphaeria pertusa TaxID=390896 RepID=A0A6A6IJR1_9PLEO|nr:uncharacterized protein BU26DRAFT_299302 [Trematosphaeria pertusa]KAF2250308.1 hypothetical protein BU26DRAFT_299302 [Trematosphaeria pertusa]